MSDELLEATSAAYRSGYLAALSDVERWCLLEADRYQSKEPLLREHEESAYVMDDVVEWVRTRAESVRGESATNENKDL